MQNLNRVKAKMVVLQKHPDPVSAFDASFLARAPGLAIRAESEADDAFLLAMFILNAPLRDVLPRAMLELQASTQTAAFRSVYPRAMRRIIVDDQQPVGRIVVDWFAADHVHGIDIAVLPGSRGRGAGLAMLRAWLDVADQIGRRCRLDVYINNPAAKIYRRLGFDAAADADLQSPSILMERPVLVKAKG
jgi:ribosomal protein S18 acetylase RimI-like enzyme